MISLEGFSGTVISELGRCIVYLECGLLRLLGTTLVQLSVLPDGVLEVLAEAQALLPVRLVLHQHLVYLSHLHTSFDLFNFNISLVQFSALLTDRPFVAVDQLLCLRVLLLVAGQSSRIVNALLVLISCRWSIAAAHGNSVD